MWCGKSWGWHGVLGFGVPNPIRSGQWEMVPCLQFHGDFTPSSKLIPPPQIVTLCLYPMMYSRLSWCFMLPWEELQSLYLNFLGFSSSLPF